MTYGLNETELKTLNSLFSANTKIEQVILYGSRAIGNFKPFSDVDITLIGNALTRYDVNHLMAEIDESSLPYQFDISLFNNLNNEELKEEIQKKGVVLYKKSGKNLLI